MKGVCNMKSFMKNLLCSIFVFILSVLFNSLIYVLYAIMYFFLDPEVLSWDLFLYIDAETMSDIVFYVVFIAFQITSLVLWFKLIGRVISFSVSTSRMKTSELCEAQETRDSKSLIWQKRYSVPFRSE